MPDFDYDVIVIGSGFGGSVSALRLTEKGYKVAVLEAGKRYEDKDFAKSSWRLRKFLWMPQLGCYGIQRIDKLKDVLILSGAGVGGGSLVYANTLYEPTVLEGVTPDAECFAGETFGPLVSLYPYRTVDDAVALANQGEYGLNASLWGKSREAKAIAPRIKAGTININEGFSATFGSVDAPMGGMRQSGLGRRQGAEGILRYTEPQAVGVQRGFPVAGPSFLQPRTYAKLLTAGLRILRRTPRA